MRYIRTKYGVYEVLTILTNGTTYITNIGAIDKNDIVKENYDIYDLCDIIIARNKKYPHDMFSIRIFEIDDDLYVDLHIGGYDEFLDAFLLDYDCYACIELPNTLKCVAKIKGVLPNNEIDWELL